MLTGGVQKPTWLLQQSTQGLRLEALEICQANMALHDDRSRNFYLTKSEIPAQRNVTMLRDGGVTFQILSNLIGNMMHNSGHNQRFSSVPL